MKKIIALLISISIMLSLSSCGTETQNTTNPESTKNVSIAEETALSEVINISENENNISEIPENFVLINGGTFEMGSPDTEVWRSEDETLHTVTVSDFFMSIYEVTQAEYSEITGNSPSNFKGDELPVENVSWLDAVLFCNAKSEKEGLLPAYSIDENSIIWDRSASGYRLPTEAEWEYACRAGTSTPFNTENSISAEESNYYGHYPYEIENNYFSQSNLSTKPGEYRQTTVAVTAFCQTHGDFTICTAM